MKITATPAGLSSHCTGSTASTMLSWGQCCFTSVWSSCGQCSARSFTASHELFPRYNSQTLKELFPPVKMRTIVYPLLCALILAAAAYGQQQIAPLPPPRAGYTFPQKQTLTYSVDWRVFPAGTAVIHFEAAGDRERITAHAHTAGAR